MNDKIKQRIDIFDTTLRDGQQSPGAGISFEDNLAYAQLAHNAGIDILEAGFPAASQDDFAMVHAIAQQMAQQQSTMTIAALCQLREEQIMRTLQALQPSLALGKARLHTYLPVDPHLMHASLGQQADNKQHIINEVYRLVQIASQAGCEVEFSPEGYSRLQHHFDFTTDVIRAAVSAGAHVINCPDTIGGASRWQGKNYFVHHMQRHADIIAQEFPQCDIIWSVHCHNDLGLALDNTLTAVFSGPARQIEGCINGVGERAGNVALEQCILAIDQFGQQVDDTYAFHTNANLKNIKIISDFIAEKMLSRQPHWPITGVNAARHTSGGHTNAILNNPLAYQPFDPQCVGSEISFVFGPLSGSNHAKNIIEQHGYQCCDKEKTVITQAIKNRYANRRKGITNIELIAAYQHYRSPICVTEITYAKNNSHHVTLQLKGNFFSVNDLEIQCDSENSALYALSNAVKQHFSSVEIVDYRSNSSGNTVNAQCQSTITVHANGDTNYIGKASDADITIAAMKAYINAVNQAYVNIYYRQPEAIHA